MHDRREAPFPEAGGLLRCTEVPLTEARVTRPVDFDLILNKFKGLRDFAARFVRASVDRLTAAEAMGFRVGVRARDRKGFADQRLEAVPDNERRTI
jgi:hypothetical protein